MSKVKCVNNNKKLILLLYFLTTNSICFILQVSTSILFYKSEKDYKKETFTYFRLN